MRRITYSRTFSWHPDGWVMKSLSQKDLFLSRPLGPLPKPDRRRRDQGSSKAERRRGYPSGRARLVRHSSKGRGPGSGGTLPVPQRLLLPSRVQALGGTEAASCDIASGVRLQPIRDVWGTGESIKVYYRKASAPASATCWSWSMVPPLTPIAPATSP